MQINIIIIAMNIIENAGNIIINDMYLSKMMMTQHFLLSSKARTLSLAQVSASDLSLPPAAEGSAEVAARVAAARQIQRQRFADCAIRTNAEAEGELLDSVATPDAAGGKLLTEAAERMKLSARGYHRVLKVARTIADLAGAGTVTKPHIAEALSYRRIAHMA